MQQYVVDVIASRIQLPAAILGPKSRENQRIILRGSLGVGPDSNESTWRAERQVVEDVVRVIPDETSPVDRPVDQENQSKQNASPNQLKIGGGGAGGRRPRGGGGGRRAPRAPG